MNSVLKNGNNKSLDDRYRFRCEHYKDGYEHPVCYMRAKPQKIGYLDIETSSLQADIGVLYSWCIKHRDLEKYDGYILQKKDYSKNERDKEAITKLIPALSQFNIIVTFFGRDYQFDVPFLRTRALNYGLQFPPYGQITHLDMYQYVKGKLKLHSNSLESVSSFLKIEPKKERFSVDIWNSASLSYDEEIMKKIWEHNKADCIILEQVHKILEPYIAITKRSL